MSINKAKASGRDFMSAAMIMGTKVPEGLRARGFYMMDCHRPDGSLKWAARSKNLVVNVGLKDMNDKYFSGAAYTAAWFIGLYGAAASNTPAAGDTSASHAGWTEVTPYSNATRPAATFGAATAANPSLITNLASPAVFTINATNVVGGAFLISDNVKGGATGILFSAADLQSPGDRNVADGDIITTTYLFALTAA